MANTAEKPILKIKNYISYSEISGFDIKIILKKIPDAKYRPNNFPATVIKRTRSVINLYDSGKLTSTKNTNLENAIKTHYTFLQELKDIGLLSCKMVHKPQIAMITSIVPIKNPVDLDILRGHPQYVKDLQSFPGIQLNFENKVNMKVYSEKLVVTGPSISSMTDIVLEILKYIEDNS